MPHASRDSSTTAPKSQRLWIYPEEYICRNISVFWAISKSRSQLFRLCWLPTQAKMTDPYTRNHMAPITYRGSQNTGKISGKGIIIRSEQILQSSSWLASVRSRYKLATLVDFTIANAAETTIESTDHWGKHSVGNQANSSEHRVNGMRDMIISATATSVYRIPENQNQRKQASYAYRSCEIKIVASQGP